MKFSKSGKPGKEVFKIDGTEVTEMEYELQMATEKARLPQIASDPEVPGNRPWGTPIQSDALAVHPDQIPEVMERNAQHGLRIDYNPADGRPILLDRDQRRRLMKIEGCHDNSGGYGDG